MKIITALTALTVVTLTFSGVFLTFSTADSFAQTNGTTIANQSAGTNTTGTYNLTSTGLSDSEGSGQISGRGRN